MLGADAAMQLVQTGATIMVGGFGLVGAPLALLEALGRSGASELTVISNNLGEPGQGLGALLRQGRIARAIGSYFTTNPEVIAAYHAGQLEVTLLPQGTMIEAIRAGGAGIPAFFTPTGAGTALAQDKETRRFGERLCVLEQALYADVALVKAHLADRLGNLVYEKTARNFNPVMATAARCVIAEVDRIVEVAELDPETIVTPQLYVDVLVERAA
ncbi:CoA transferase subunit A [bacterium]|nr:MAG: CoA transferase subunit A [bacterium]